MIVIARMRNRRSHIAPQRVSQHAFFGVSALLFAASAAVAIGLCASMSAMGEMPMPGGWAMSMAWMRMPGQTWPGAFRYAAFAISSRILKAFSTSLTEKNTNGLFEVGSMPV